MEIMFFSQDMNQRSLERLKLENNLRRAMERNELMLNYQPQLDLASRKDRRRGSAVAMEPRWR